MQTTVHEIAAGLFRISTHVPDIAPPAGFTFNQFVVVGEQPLLFHTGPRRMFPLVRDAVARIIDPTSLRWIAFGHVEADECGSMNEWLALAPHAEVAHGEIGAGTQLGDLADRPPRALADGTVLDLGGGKRVRYVATPHVPHAWDAGVLFEESTRTLLCGDLFTQVGAGPALVRGDIVGPAIAAEDLFAYSSLNPAMGTTIRALAALAPRTLALMHGPAYEGDGAAALRALAADYDRRAERRGIDLAA
jgi:flavorubredoxin